MTRRIASRVAATRSSLSGGSIRSSRPIQNANPTLCSAPSGASTKAVSPNAGNGPPSSHALVTDSKKRRPMALCEGAQCTATRSAKCCTRSRATAPDWAEATPRRHGMLEPIDLGTLRVVIAAADLAGETAVADRAA